ncbi:hypothetical protein LINGRAHAP2_LOCUS3865, partial [Linum grandiflorum]
ASFPLSSRSLFSLAHHSLSNPLFSRFSLDLCSLFFNFQINEPPNKIALILPRPELITI